jgi:hypothetical protein
MTRRSEGEAAGAGLAAIGDHSSASVRSPGSTANETTVPMTGSARVTTGRTGRPVPDGAPLSMAPLPLIT